MQKILVIDSTNNVAELTPITTSAGATDAGKLFGTDGTGHIDLTLLPDGIGADTKTAVASENLSAGDIVNIWNNTSVLGVRKADASGGVAKKAIGFVKSAVTSGQTATIYLDGTINGLTGLTIGATYVLSDTTAGGVLVLASAPSATGHILQTVGVASSATELLFEAGDPIIRA
jgi:hypothetical protein